MAEAQQQPATKQEATPILRGLISDIRMTPDLKASDGHRVELVGVLAGILGLPSCDQIAGDAYSGAHRALMRKTRRLAGLVVRLSL